MARKKARRSVRGEAEMDTDGDEQRRVEAGGWARVHTVSYKVPHFSRRLPGHDGAHAVPFSSWPLRFLIAPDAQRARQAKQRECGRAACWHEAAWLRESKQQSAGCESLYVGTQLHRLAGGE